MDGDLAELHRILNRLIPAVKKGVQAFCGETTQDVETKPTNLELLKFTNPKMLSTAIVLSAYQYWEDPILVIKVRYDDDEFRTIPDDMKDVESLETLEFFKQPTEFKEIAFYKLGIEVWDRYEKNYLQEGLGNFKTKKFGIKQSQSFEIEVYWNQDFEEISNNKSLIWAEQFAAVDLTMNAISESVMMASQLENGMGASRFDASAFIAANFEDLTKLEEFQEKVIEKRKNITHQQFGNFGKKKGAGPSEIEANYSESYYNSQFVTAGVNFDVDHQICQSITQSMAPFDSELRAPINGGHYEESEVLEEEYFPNQHHDQEDDLMKMKSAFMAESEDPDENTELEEVEFEEYKEDIQLGRFWGPPTQGKLRVKFQISPEYTGETTLDTLV